MASSITNRASPFLHPKLNHVDISKCNMGNFARAIKPGGVCKIVESIRELGYKRVFLVHHSLALLYGSGVQSGVNNVSIVLCLDGRM
jgi:hypothetical protein